METLIGWHYLTALYKRKYVTQPYQEEYDDAVAQGDLYKCLMETTVEEAEAIVAKVPTWPVGRPIKSTWKNPQALFDYGWEVNSVTPYTFPKWPAEVGNFMHASSQKQDWFFSRVDHEHDWNFGGKRGPVSQAH